MIVIYGSSGLFIELIFVSENIQSPAHLKCIVRSPIEYKKEVDPRWLELVLGIVGGELVAEGLQIDGAFVEKKQDTVFMGLFVNKCSQVAQIEVRSSMSIL